MGDGSEPNQGMFGKLLSAGKRALTGESIFMTHFTNIEGGKKRVTFSAPYPGKIIPIDLESSGGEILCQKDAFLCAAMGTRLSVEFSKSLVLASSKMKLYRELRKNNNEDQSFKNPC